MAPISILFGLLLVAVGLIGFMAPDVLGANDPAKSSTTALIPAYLGGVLVLCGVVVALKPTLRKHMMHLAALVGLVGAAGGFMPLSRSGWDFSKASAVSGLLTVVLCVTFVVLCVRSFIQARRARAS